MVISAGISGRAGSPNVGTISGFSCTSLRGWNSGLVNTHSSFTRRGADNSISVGRETTSGCRTTSGRVISGSGFSAELRPSPLSMWTDDHGAGLCHHGRRLELAGRRYGNRLANGRLATYVMLRTGIHSISAPLTKMALHTG